MIMEPKYYMSFDIETTPLDWNTFSESQKEYWLRGAKTDEEIEEKMNRRSLTPLTSHIACIACMIMEKKDDEWIEVKKGVLATNPKLDIHSTSEEAYEETLVNDVKMIVSSEYKVLKNFWNLINYYRNVTLVSFNGRNFDAPFIMLRSALQKIKPSRNLMAGTKFNYFNHIDLIDELTFYNGGSFGATQRFNFDFYAYSFGLHSPKADGVHGGMVPDLYAAGEIKEISEYCMRDVVATWQLFECWNQYLNFSNK